MNIDLLKEQVAFLDTLLFILGALLMVTGGTIAGTWLRPHNPNPEKLSSYESGEEAVGSAWIPFNVRFYGIALIFILFEIETILLFPWALTWADSEINPATDMAWMHYSAVVGTSFILILSVGLFYAYKKGHFNWVNQKTISFNPPAAIPQSYYEKINQRYANSHSSKDKAE